MHFVCGMVGNPLVCPLTPYVEWTFPLSMLLVVLVVVCMPSIQHNDVRDLTAKLLTEVCSNVSIEPSLQPLTGEILNHRTSNTEEGERLDICAQGIWGDRHQCAFIDVRIFTLAPSKCRSSLASTYRQHESLKQRHYEQCVREIEHGSFTPLVFSATGCMAPAATKDLLLSWQTSASRTTARRSAGTSAQSAFL